MATLLRCERFGYFLPHLDASLGRSHEFCVSEVHYAASHSLRMFWDSRFTSTLSCTGQGRYRGRVSARKTTNCIQCKHSLFQRSARERPTRSSELSGFWTKVVIFVICESTGVGCFFTFADRTYIVYLPSEGSVNRSEEIVIVIPKYFQLV
jgi:hypothetical protein